MRANLGIALVTVGSGAAVEQTLDVLSQAVEGSGHVVALDENVGRKDGASGPVGEQAVSSAAVHSVGGSALSPGPAVPPGNNSGHPRGGRLAHPNGRRDLPTPCWGRVG